MSQYDANTFIWTGLDTLQAVIRNASPRVTDFLGSSMSDVMEDVYEQSQQQVPVATGALRGSGYLNPPQIAPGNIQIKIGYGAPYAYFVHENLSAHHDVGKAKFLEDPLTNALNSLSSRLAGRMEGAIMGQGAGAGSYSHAGESVSMSRKGASRRQMSHRTPMSHENVEKAMAKMRQHEGTHPNLRPAYHQSRGKIRTTLISAPEVRFNYDPTREGRRGDLRHPG